MIKQAIIPLAGLGTRLLPLTSVFAKELLPINGKPGIQYILDECIEAGIKEVVFIISKKKQMIKNYFYNDNFYKKIIKKKKDKRILKEFNNSGVDGVIIDLRGNSGGALIEANKLTGLFVSSGATVQVKENSGRIGSWGDYYARQEWKKPILVLVDRYSASASEIFAGAIQDYKRGLVVGHRTFGKGTVQAIESLTSGQIKITESKFYRVTGESTQNRGVIPDIQLPSSWDIESTGESSLHLSLPWDTIPAVRYRAFKIDSDIVDAVKKSHLNRLDQSPNLEYIQNLRTRYDLAKNKKELSLNINNRKLEKEERKDWILSNENNRRENLGLEVFADYSAMEEFDKQKKEEDIDIDLENDYLLEEATNIIADYIYLNQNLIISKLN